ncbi:hypothetical protein RhiirC2_705367 [Rhizophagus irregularis]|uniref:DUF8211 domain-containing protein n=1 Tax=Rhizophagus irregularis TaxID=588596 RepID=A0A2N1NYU5_9GLOM|nr:hypothetical protein RhiirC2_705367 [Rhizophagus irregularis]
MDKFFPFFPRADATDFENINLGYENKNDFSNLSLIKPIQTQAPTVLNISKKHKILSSPIVLPTRNSLSRPTSAITNSLSPGKNNPLKISFSKFHVTLPRRSGYNKIYEIRRSKSFFFELDDHPQNTNDIHLKIHTNDYHMKTKPISYNNTSTIPNAKYQISLYGNKHMYRKRLSNFQLQQSKHPVVKKKQVARFLRACRRVFKIKEHNPPDLYRHRSQYVNKPVKHLTYNHGLVSDVYNFRTPHYYKTSNHVTLRADGRQTTISQARLSPAYLSTAGYPWVQPYQPYPNMFIPYKYRDIIPKDPLYTDTGDYIVPGSCTWFTYMSELYRNISTDKLHQRQCQIQALNEAHIRRQEVLLQQQLNDAKFHAPVFIRYLAESEL